MTIKILSRVEMRQGICLIHYAERFIDVILAGQSCPATRDVRKSDPSRKLLCTRWLNPNWADSTNSVGMSSAASTHNGWASTSAFLSHIVGFTSELYTTSNTYAGVAYD